MKPELPIARLTIVLSAALAVALPPLAGGQELAAGEAGGPAVPLLQRHTERLERAVDVHERRVERRRERRERQAERRRAAKPDFASPESVGVSMGTLDAIAGCESGGDPGAVSADGTYRGKYQFDAATWAAMGGSGDPAAAPEAEQDMRAAMLYAASGSSPWPVCGA